ncbi:MAG TPA: YafY family protein [Streptosporangiaceae bacterium]
MANTSTRTLKLLSLLQTHRFWPGTELAARLGVTPRTLRRDVDRLRELGYPVQAQRGADGGYQLAAGAALPPLMVDDEEAVALAVGLRLAANGTVEGIAESSVRALAKVLRVMPSRLRRRAEAVTAMTVPATWGSDPQDMVDADVLTVIALACRDNERIRFSYAAASSQHSGQQTDRLVEPHRVVMLGRRWYLAGYDLGRHDWRSFRLDRVSHPEVTGARFLPRELPAPDAAAFVRAGIATASAIYDVEVEFDAPAGLVRERIGRWARITELDDGRCRGEWSADVLDWAAFALGTAGVGFRVIGPPELRDVVGAWGRRFARAVSLAPAGFVSAGRVR